MLQSWPWSLNPKLPCCGSMLSMSWLVQLFTLGCRHQTDDLHRTITLMPHHCFHLMGCRACARRTTEKAEVAWTCLNLPYGSTQLVERSFNSAPLRVHSVGSVVAMVSGYMSVCWPQLLHFSFRCKNISSLSSHELPRSHRTCRCRWWWKEWWWRGRYSCNELESVWRSADN